jgi:hypothetical protein
VTTTEVPPALYEHCCAVYRLMEGKASRRDDMVVYEGFLTRDIMEPPLHLSVPYYTSIRRELTRMGCIRQLRRGGGSAPSQWELLRAPTVDLYREQEPLRKPGQRRMDVLEQQVRDMRQQLTEQHNVIKVLSEIVGWSPGE